MFGVSPPSRPYHHGNLRRVLLDATVDVIAESGPVGFSLRELARRAGVSHGAPAHHFADKAGLLTAFAVEGFDRLAEALRRAWVSSDRDLLAVGVAYVQFAVAHRPHFEVMFRRDLVDATDPQFVAAARAASAALLGGVREQQAVSLDPAVAAIDIEALAIGLWSQMHGLATLLMSGNLDANLGDLEGLVRRVSAAIDAAARATPSVPSVATSGR
jgi:AcrR family transcriptional regulator